MLKVVVDVDSTLWDMYTPLWKLLVREDINIPEPKFWYKWNFWEDYISEKLFYNIVNFIHSSQLDYKPFKDAEKLLLLLHKLGYYVIIASHRRQEQTEVLQKWCEINNLYYDEIHCCTDKSELFDKDVVLVIDDSPEVIQDAKDNNIKCFGIKYSWNKSVLDNGFDNLSQIYNYLKA